MLHELAQTADLIIHITLMVWVFWLHQRVGVLEGRGRPGGDR